jgi:Ni,Fe-hydrogenase maturation factor
MKVYVFGNEDQPDDKLAFAVAEKLKNRIKGLKFVKVSPNQDLPFAGEKKVVILDVVQGINKVTEINNPDLDRLILSKSITVHDFDLGYQLKYLKKIGKLGEITIIGLPIQENVDYFLIQSILRKLTAQDMQGS